MKKLVLAALLLPTPALAGATVSHSVGLTDADCFDVIPGYYEVCMTYDGVMTEVSTPSGVSHYIFIGEIEQENIIGGTVLSTYYYDRKRVFHSDEDGASVSKIDQCVDLGGIALEFSSMYTNGKTLWLDFTIVDSCE